MGRPQLERLIEEGVVQLEAGRLTMGMLYDLVVQEGRCHHNDVNESWEIIWCVDRERRVVVAVNTEGESETEWGKCWRESDKGYRSEGYQEVMIEWGKW